MSDSITDEKVTQRLVDLVEQSGFPLQLALETVARSGYDRKEHSWDPVARELPWKAGERDEDGYIDLVLQAGEIMVATVECKRSAASWIFLLPDGTRDEGADSFRCRLAEGTSRGLGGSNYFDMRMDPTSAEAEFCVLAGSGNRHRLLEHYCAGLVTATEAIAHSREAALHGRKEPFRAAYIPMIVTTARLYSCEFAPGKVALRKATLTEPRFREERWIRFRKSLSTRGADGPARDDLERVKSEAERSVFVVQATEFGGFLKATSRGRFQYSETRSWPLEFS